MGHVKEFNFDIDRIILLEITVTPTLRDLIEASHLYWILLVAPRIASVTASLDLVDLDDLDNAVAVINENNQQTIHEGE